MPVKMAPHQLAFWRELLAPFADDDLSKVPGRGGKPDLTYLNKRSLSNRLDSVCGPNGWDIEYKPTNRGYTARLGILCPSFGDTDTWVWHYKEDGAGFEEMGSVNKETKEFEYDVDNDEKSGYTNAFRRVAQDAWGIGRYLYNKGIPTFLDPRAQATTLPPVDNAMAAASKPPADLADKTTPVHDTRQAPPEPAPATAPPAADNRPKYDNFKIPPAGKSVFAWCKEMERSFETALFDGMSRDGEKEGWGKQFANWDQTQVNTVCLGVIRYIRELPTYKGQFEYMFPGGVADAKIPTTSGSGPNTKPPEPGVNIADVRKTLMVKMQALVAKQTGKTPDNAELKAAFKTIAAHAKNVEGHAGLVPESLSSLTDLVWINNMLTIVDAEIAACTGPADAGDPSIPF